MGTDRDPGDQNQQPPPRDPKMQLARVLLPDGVHKEFDVSKTAEGEELFSQVTRDLSIEEREYFQLCFYDKAEGTRHWLYNEKSISKQLKGLPWEFSFEVKFYPTTPTTVVDDHARYYLFLQLRRDLLTGRLPATPEIHALLGSFVAQIEFGDAPSQIADDYEKFIVGAKLVPSTLEGAETFAKIAELHRALRGQTASDAENMFLENSRQLALYGIHLYKATDKDKKAVEVGIGAAGINIYQNDEKIHSFDWKDIVKIGYKRTSFTVKLKAGILGKHEKTVEFKFPSYSAAKKTWKCAVEHHTFFRLIQPEEKQTGLLTFGSGRFRYQGRTQFQTKIASQMFDKPSTVDRAPSAMSQAIGVPEEHRLQTLNQTDAELEHRQFESKKKDNKKSSSKNGGKNETSGETSDSEHDEKREFAVVEFEPTHATKQSPPKKPEHRTAKVPSSNEPMNEVTVFVTSGNSEDRPKELKNTKEVRHETREQQFRLTGEGYTSGFNPDDPESGQPYTTVSTWQETSDLPEQVEVYTDENGRQITRTVKSSQVKHTVQTQSFQNYIVDGDQLPVGVVDVERSREQLTPLGQQASSSGGAAGAVGGDAAENSAGIVETQTRTMTYEAAGGAEAPPGWAEQGLGEYVSSKSVTQGNRTIETITYKTEKDGVVETHVEHRVTIHSDGDIDHDAELSQAILEATQMNPDMVVEKIEVRQETTQ